MHRPYINLGSDELRALFEAHHDDTAVLEQLQAELSQRKIRSARQLNIEVLERLQELEACEEADQTPEPESGEPDAEPAGIDPGVDQTHPDDQRRPTSISRIRPPGTRGLPDAWRRPLAQDLKLPVGNDSSLPDLFVTAISALVGQIKRSGAGQKRYDLANGERLEAAREDILYRFPFADEADLFEDAQIVLQVEGRKLEGSIVSIAAGRLVLALKDDLGAEIPRATLIIDTTALLAALSAKIEQVKKGEVTLNRNLADCIAGRSGSPVAPGPISAIAPAELYDAQKRAFQQACTAAVTWIWGPPGCGKTKTLGEIVRAAFENGRRVLVCSNTNKAVDQVLVSICETLGTDPAAMQDGKVVRLGRMADNKLKAYESYVTVDGIVERKSVELQQQRHDRECAIELLDARTLKNRGILARFGELDEAAKVAAEAQALFRGRAAEADGIERALQGNAQRIRDLKVELFKRQTAFFTIFSRSEAEILRDLSHAETECAGLADRSMAAEQCVSQARHGFEAAVAAHQGLREELAQQDRNALMKAVEEADDQRADLVAKLQDIEVKIAAIRDTVVQGARVLGMTCTKAYLAVKEIGQLDTVIIDEASMVMLPVAWFAAGLARERVIVCGDFRQIPPIVQSDQRSIVEAIGKDPFSANDIRENDPRLVMLDTQYRMHDDICRLIAKPMYEGRLHTADDRRNEVGSVPAKFDRPLTIIDTSALWPFESQNAFFSRFNLMHALLVRNLAMHFSDEGAIADQAALGICTPYSAQAKIIAKMLEDERLGDAVQVGTVHSYQGDERATMVLDIPESHGGARNLGQFVQGLPPDHVGARLINVAISRAKHRLIVLANLTYLDGKLPSTSLLRTVLYGMQESGAVVSGNDVLALRPFARDLKGLLGRIPLDELAETFGIFDEAAFERALELDISEAQSSVVIFSGYVTPARVGKLGDLLRSKIAEGIKVRCVTRPPQTNGSIPREQGRQALDMLEGIGVTVDCRAKIHQKVCLIDNRIVWLGSLNALSHAGRADETMTRAVNEGYATAVAAHMSKRRVSTDRAAAMVAEAENPRCQQCGCRTIYIEGRHGPFYACESECGWRSNERSLSDDAVGLGAATAQKTAKPARGPDCPKCGKHTNLRSSRYGPFYGCSDFPDCTGKARIDG